MRRFDNFFYTTANICFDKMFELMERTFHSKIFWISAFLALFYLYLKKVVYSYWKNHGIPQEDTTVPTGIFDTDFFMRKITVGNVLKKSYQKFKQYRYHGIYMFNNRVLMINDPDLIKQVLVKDFANFCDRGLYSNKEIDPVTGHLFFLSGDEWRALRAKLSPTFTSGKLKHMFSILNAIGTELISVADDTLLKTNILELKDLVARYTTDTIFSLAFGLNSNCLREPKSQFRHYGLLSVENSMIRTALGLFAPYILDTFRQPFTNPDVSKFFIQLFKDMVEKRKLEKVRRNDFLDSLIDLMDHEQNVDKDMINMANGINSDKIARRLNILEATAQAFVFFIAGFETSSSIATHCLYELALNPDEQQKVQEEIDEYLQNFGSLTYDNLLNLERLDMAFYETMRKHPSVPFLNRVSLNDYKIPDSDFNIEKGTNIIISVSGLHKDPEIYPDPEKFDPTRFSKENIATRHPYTYLAFGEGPRICIGKRLGILQSKVALFHMLANYKFSVCDKTPIPNEYSRDTVLQTPLTGIYLKAEKRITY